MALPTPAHHQAARRIDLLVLAARDVLAIDVDAIAPARTRVELGADAHPGHEAPAIRQIGEHDLRRRLDPPGDLDRTRQVLNHGGVSLLALLPPPARGAGRGRESTSGAARPRADRAPADSLCNSGGFPGAVL